MFSHLPLIRAHAPTDPTVRLHYIDSLHHPLGSVDGVNYHRPFLEDEITVDNIYTTDKLVYYMVDAQYIAHELTADLVPWRHLTVEWRPPAETNIWIGTPTLTTPAHYDFMHNFYTQIVGMKRFVMFPPSDYWNLYIFPYIHPSSRQTQIDFDNPNIEEFPGYKKLKALEVILEPGNTLYIPPGWFHMVSVVGKNASISLSVHLDSVESENHEAVYGMIDRIHRFLRRVSLDQDFAWKVKLLLIHVNSLFENPEIAKQGIGKIYESHWSHLHIDNHSEGLHDLFVEKRDQFPPSEQVESSTISDDILIKLDRYNIALKQIFKDMRPEWRDILRSNYIETIAYKLLEELNVEPFLRIFTL
eukprot:TRINITY_DN3171_c0_g1_i2.p1 TRINITY_DN3171_c0_g1~~TRINITY_DN3171_c0_g1_i2.p1  ORF type:complete len:359 (+),score=69.72 TRINITY_DN3171_c0_g1_i2:616-1692(+)